MTSEPIIFFGKNCSIFADKIWIFLRLQIILHLHTVLITISYSFQSIQKNLTFFSRP